MSNSPTFVQRTQAVEVLLQGMLSKIDHRMERESAALMDHALNNAMVRGLTQAIAAVKEFAHHAPLHDSDEPLTEASGKTLRYHLRGLGTAPHALEEALKTINETVKADQSMGARERLSPFFARAVNRDRAALLSLRDGLNNLWLAGSQSVARRSQAGDRTPPQKPRLVAVGYSEKPPENGQN